MQSYHVDGPASFFIALSLSFGRWLSWPVYGSRTFNRVLQCRSQHDPKYEIAFNVKWSFSRHLEPVLVYLNRLGCKTWQQFQQCLLATQESDSNLRWLNTSAGYETKDVVKLWLGIENLRCFLEQKVDQVSVLEHKRRMIDITLDRYGRVFPCFIVSSFCEKREKGITKKYTNGGVIPAKYDNA